MQRPLVAKLSSESSDANYGGSRRNPRGPDGSWGWLIVFCSFICNMIVDGVQYTFANFLTPITMSLQSSVPEVSLIGSLLSGFYNLSGPIASALGNKFGFRMVAITGSLVSSMGLMISYFAPNVHFLYFFYGILGGLGFGMIYMASVIATSIYFDRYRALAVSISVCGTGVGTFVFAPLGNFLVTNYSWRWALVVEGGIILVCIVCGLTFRPVELMKMVPMSAQVSDAAISTARGSMYFGSGSAERRKTLPNAAYPTLKEAMIHHADADRRSTVISLMPKSQRTSILDASDSFIALMDFKELVNDQTPRTRKEKFMRFWRVLCFNFWHCRCRQRDLTLGDRPMYRDDVFYGDDLSVLKRSHSDALSYHLSVTRIPDPREVVEHMGQKCCVCHHAFLRTFLTMIGLNLLKSKIFSFLCISSFLYTMGLYMPYVFIREFGAQCGVPDNVSVWLVSAIGISNTAGRLASGIVKSFFKVNAALLVLLCLTISGLYTFVFFFCRNLACLVSYSCVFGFFTAPFISLRPVIIVDFLGLEKLTNAFGVVLLCQGIASIIGPPMAGLIVGGNQNYALVMYLAASLMLLSALSLLMSTMIKWNSRKSNS